MKKLLLPILTLLIAGPFASAQTAGKTDYQIKRVTVEFIQTPDFQFTGTKKASKPEKWMEIECDFDARPEFSDELVFTYYVYFNKRLFVGSVTHVNVEKGNDLHSVMYISPKMVSRITGGKPVNPSELNTTVQVTKPGIAQALAEKSFKQAQTGWWSAMKQETGYVVNKAETPFAPLYWDRYEAIKSPAQR